jgi:long-chain fatty acid transport protein
MDRLQHMRVVTVLAVIGVTSSALANGFRNPPEGAWAMGRTGGKIAQVDDASAVTHNPANLTQVPQPEAAVSLTLIHTETEFSAPYGSTGTEDPWKFLPNVFVAVPLEDRRFAAGLAVTTPFGQSTVWDEAGLFRYSAPYSAELAVINVNPAVAMKVTDSVSVGAGLDVFLSRLDLKQWIPWSRVTGRPMSPDGAAQLQGDGVGVGANAALTVRPADGHAVALTYRSPVTVDYEGECELGGFPAGAEGAGLSRSSDFETSVEFPTIVGLGYGVEVTDKWRVEADVEWIEFSRYDALELDAGNNNLLLNSPQSASPTAPAVVRQDWKDTWTFGVGTDYAVTETVTLRAGYIYLQSPIPDETLAPTLPDADRHVVSLGAGFRQGRNRLDLGYAYSLIGDRDIGNNQNPAYNGTYETTSHLMSVAYGRTF